MALPALASSDDLQARLGRAITAAETVRVPVLLDDASVLARDAGETTWVDAETGALTVVPDVVKVVVIRAAIRALTNPDDNIASEQLGPAQFTYRTNEVYLTKAERKMIRRAAGLGGIGSITLESPYQHSPTPNVLMLDDDGDGLPWITLPRGT